VTTSAAFFYLAFVVSERRLVVAFPHTLPQLSVLQDVYRSALAALDL
jgi:hypothetical protein